MTGDDVFHPNDDDWNPDLEFVLQDWEDSAVSDESDQPRGAGAEYEGISEAEDRSGVRAEPAAAAGQGSEADTAPETLDDQAIVFGDSHTLHPDVGWHEFDLESVFQDIVDQSVSESVEEGSGQFDLLTGEEEELILIDESGLAQVPQPGESLSGGAEDEWTTIDYSDRDFEVSEDQDPDWAPVDDPHLQGEELEADAEYTQGSEFDGQPDYSDYEEAYCEEVEEAGAPTVIRNAWWRRVAGVAAAAVILGLSSLYIKTPDSVVVDVEPRLATVVNVGRPAPLVDLEMPTPLVVGSGAKAPAPSMELAAPVVEPVAAASEEAHSSAAPVEPEARPEVPAVVEAVPAPVDELAETGAARLAMAGGDLEAGIMERHRETIVQSENGLVMGGQAIAKLFNENVFVGTVKALNSSFVTLRVKTGEVTLARKSIQSLTTLAASEAARTNKDVKPGSVRLRNRNRLRGQLVETRKDAVIVQVDSSRVVVPIAEVQEVSRGGAKRPVKMGERIRIESDPWFKRLVEGGLGGSESAASRAPAPTKARPEK